MYMNLHGSQFYEKWFKKTVHFAREYYDDGSDPVLYLEIW